MSVQKPTRKYGDWKPGAWASTLPKSYFEQMRTVVDEMHKGVFSDTDRAEGYAEYITVRNVFGRMEIAQTQLLPWLRLSIPDMSSREVLEIGCGTGSATAPLAMASKFVHAFDLDASTVRVAKTRCELLAVENIRLFSEDGSWTKRFADDPVSISGKPVDVIVCYALLEHLLPLERIDLLVGAWKLLANDGYLVVIETPNRLYPFDWHSSQLPFMDQLPDEIAYLWNGFSPRTSVPKDTRAMTRNEARLGNRERLFRFGRGASFHEFHTALGPAAYEIANISVPADRVKFAGWNRADIENLARQLGELDPPVSPMFAQPCLDLVVRKTGSARLT